MKSYTALITDDLKVDQDFQHDLCVAGIPSEKIIREMQLEYDKIVSPIITRMIIAHDADALFPILVKYCSLSVQRSALKSLLKLKLTEMLVNDDWWFCDNPNLQRPEDIFDLLFPEGENNE